MANSELPIDRGWAWVITFACCGMFGFVTSGFKSQGIVIVELRELYPERPVKDILWIFSMCNLINRLSAPLNGLILTKTSHRTLAFLGITLMSSGLVMFAYVPSIDYMYPVYGMAYGLGAGMVTLATFTAYGPYFDKMKALSLGFTAAGSGIMTMIIPCVLRALFDNFSFSGTILLYAGIALHMFILASLLRPIKFYERAARLKATKQSKEDVWEVRPTTECNQLDMEENYRQRSFSACVRSSPSAPLTPRSLSTSDVTSDLFHGHQPQTHEYLLSAYSIQDIGATGVVLSQSNDEPNAKKEKSFNWRLIYHPRSILLGLGTLSFVSGLSITYQCIPSLGEQAGVTKQFITLVLLGAGALEIPMRITNGVLADSKVISVYVHLTLCMAFTGLMAVLCGIVSGRAGIILMLVGTSFTGTSVMNLLPIANGELLGKENLYSAMSINYFYQGLALIASTFPAAAIYETTEKWENVFLFIGGCNLFGSFIIFVTMVISKFLNRQKENRASL